jgi:hypothetical protein
MNSITHTARWQSRTSTSSREEAGEVDIDAEDGLQDEYDTPAPGGATRPARLRESKSI